MSVSPSLDSILRRIQILIRGLNDLIRTVSSNIKISGGMAATLFASGVALTLYFFLSGKGRDMQPLMNLGPSLIGLAVSAIPLKVVFDGRERMVSYNYLKFRGENCDDLSVDELLALEKELEDAIREARKR